MSRMIACYGSLKRGFYNHGRCGEQTFIGETKVRGKMTLVYGAYPQLMLKEDGGGDEHVVEVFMVDDITFQQIDIMEIGAGYIPITIATPYGEARMWVFTEESAMSGVPIKAYDASLFEANDEIEV